MDEADSVLLAVDRRLVAHEASGAPVLVLLADFPFGGGHDVADVGVHAEEAGGLGDDADLLLAFTYRAPDSRLSPMFWAPPGKAHWPV